MPSFIGNPGGVNRFDEDAVVNGISGWTGTLTPEQIAQLPWNAGVQPAGGAFDLPGGNPQAAIDFQESTGGVDPNNFREEMNLAVAGLTGLPGGVPAQAVKRIQSGYQAAIPRYIEVVQSGRHPKEAEAIVFDPLRNEAKSLFAEYKYREPKEDKEPTLSWVIQQDPTMMGEDVKVRLTPTAFASQFPTLPDYAKTNMANQVQLRAFGIEPAGTSRPNSVQETVIIMTNPSGQSVKVPQSQVEKAKKLGYK